MSGQLTTSGVVNWDAVLSRSVNLVIGVLARLDKAGISPFTVEVGRVLCRNIPLEAGAQLRITHAIFVLTRYGSYGNAIWFGFGIKQVVRDLAEPEEGMALVALCAALGTAYEPFFSAQVLREFCRLSGAPPDITPALRQWEMLVKLCAGILSTGEFMDKVNGFNRLVFGHSVNYRSPKCEPTKYGDLAKAITVIAEVAHRRKANASFLGGLDCAWLAALSEWILCLDVSVVDSNGTEFYRSRMTVRDMPQVTILMPDRPSKSLLSSQNSIVPPGKSTSWLASHSIDSLEENKSSEKDNGSLHWRSSRSRILRDTFGSRIDALSEKETAQWFALYLESSSMLQRPDPRLFNRYRTPENAGHRPTARSRFPLAIDRSLLHDPMDPSLWAQETHKSRQFRSFASKYLPELTDCLRATTPTVSQDEAENSAIRALDNIDSAWPSSSDQNDGGIENEAACHEVHVKTMVQVITVFLWISFVNDVEDDVFPSVTGLANLYYWYLNGLGDKATPKPSGFVDLGPEYKWLDMVFNCFSGSVLRNPFEVRSPMLLARAGGGICVYYRALENPDTPPGFIFKLRVVRGYITHEGSQFDGIRDIPPSFQGQEEKIKSEALPDNSTKFTIDMMIQETNLEPRLAISFRVHYLGLDGKDHSAWLRLGELYQIMQRTLIPRRCRGNCDPLYNLENVDDALCNWRNTSMDTPNITKEKIVEVQRAVESLRDTSTIWMLTRFKSQQSQPLYRPVSTSTILGRPLFLYILMLQDDPSEDDLLSLLTLSPFVNCLSCIVEYGSWVSIGEFRASMGVADSWVDHGGVVELILPDGSKLEFTWEESARGKKRREKLGQNDAALGSYEKRDQESSDIADQEFPESADQESYDIADQHSYEGDESGAS